MNNHTNIGAYVINLLRRPERKERMQQLCAGLEDAGVAVEFLPATDAQDLVDATLQTYQGKLFHPWKCADSPNKFHNRLLRAGEVACGMSHLRVWRAAAERSLDLTLVLEDDADFQPDIWTKIQAEIAQLDAMGRDWDLLYLGRCPPRDDHCDLQQYSKDGVRVTANVVVPGFSYCTYGYLLSARGLQRMLAARFDETIMPLDEFIPALYTHHPRDDVRAKLQDRERLVALAWTDEAGNELVLQHEVGPVAISGSDTESSACIDVLPDGSLDRVQERLDLRDEMASIRMRASDPLARFRQRQQELSL